MEALTSLSAWTWSLATCCVARRRKLSNEYQAVCQEYEELTSTLVSTQQELETCREEERRLSLANLALQDGLQEINVELEAVKQQHRDQLVPLNLTIEDQRKQLTAVEADRDTQKTLLAESDARNEELEQQTGDHCQARQLLEDVVAGQKVKLDRASAQVVELHDTLREVLIQRQKARSASEKELSNALRARTESDSARKEYEWALIDAKSQAICDEHVKDALKEQLADVRSTNSTLAGQVERLLEQNAELLQEQKHTKKTIAKLTKSKSDLEAAAAAAAAASAKAGKSSKYVDYSEPVGFSRSLDKDLRIEFGKYQGMMRVDIREWYSNARSRKGVSIPVKDARRLAKILPEVVAQAMEQ